MPQNPWIGPSNRRPPGWRPGRVRVEPGTSVWADREYDDAETEFLRAAEAYRQEHKRISMRATDYLRVLLSLGYRKGPPDEPDRDADR